MRFLKFIVGKWAVKNIILWVIKAVIHKKIHLSTTCYKSRGQVARKNYPKGPETRGEKKSYPQFFHTCGKPGLQKVRIFL